MTNNPSSKSVDEILDRLLEGFGYPTEYYKRPVELEAYSRAKQSFYQLIKDRVIGENEYVINPVGELKVRQERGDMFHRNQFRNSQRKALQELFEVKDDKNGDLLK